MSAAISREDAIKYAAKLYAEGLGRDVPTSYAAMSDILGHCAIRPRREWLPAIRLAFDDYFAAAADASLGVGHVWTNTACKAYSTYRPTDCVCNG